MYWLMCLFPWIIVVSYLQKPRVCDCWTERKFDAYYGGHFKIKKEKIMSIAHLFLEKTPMSETLGIPLDPKSINHGWTPENEITTLGWLQLDLLVGNNDSMYSTLSK